jgi:phosphoglycolate phosphatase
MIKCVSFDFDGTLVNSNDIKKDTFFEIALPWDASGEVVTEVYERWPAADRYEKTRKIAEGLINRKLLPEDSSVERWGARLANDYTACTERAITNCSEMPGASQALTELSEMGLLLFVNSATPISPLRRILELRHWAHFFRAVYGAEASKADNLRSLANESETTMNEIVHVGDQTDDRRGAEQFGCHFVAMADACTVSTVRESPLLVENLRALPTLITRLSRETL